MNKTMLTRGFTLIELLVVIAIIGILAAVVIGSLNDARSSGQDASIKQSVANVRSQAELFYNKNGYTYEGSCADAGVQNLLKAATKVVNGSATIVADGVAAGNSATAPTSRIAACHDTDTTYVAASPLTGGTNFWCVDSTGVSKSVTALATTATACP